MALLRHSARHAIPIKRNFAPTAVVSVTMSTNPPEKQNWFLWMLGYYSNETTRLRNAESIFLSCANQAARKAWLSRGCVPSEFRPRHALVVTHVWLVHQRLLAASKKQAEGSGDDSGLDPKEFKALQEGLFDMLWEDTTMRIRSTGIAELMVNKSLGEVQKYSFPQMVGFDQAVVKSTIEDQDDLIGATLWRSVWLGDRFVTVEHCLEMAKYVREQQAMLAQQDTAAVVEGRIPWSRVPTWQGIKSMVDDTDLVDDTGRILGKKSPGGGDGLTGESTAAAAKEAVAAKEDGEEDDDEWREALANTGKTYYWNIKTRESRWEKPEGGFAK
mmetsp:Transcript_69284/g.139360  ORF Transcript_69284/g.139360 Transcript_69284/m.139360 type:complete len:329 (+) Transcript_69284:79-1065(+)